MFWSILSVLSLPPYFHDLPPHFLFTALTVIFFVKKYSYAKFCSKVFLQGDFSQQFKSDVLDQDFYLGRPLQFLSTLPVTEGYELEAKNTELSRFR